MKNLIFNIINKGKVKKFLTRETFAYIIAGTITTVLGFVLFGIFMWFFNRYGRLSTNSPGLAALIAGHPWLNYVPNLTASLRAFTAEIISVFFSLVFSFVANKQFVFQSKSWKFRILSRELVSFLSLRLLSIGIETAVVVGMVSFLSAGTMAAKLTGTLIVIVINYVLSKTVIFKTNAPRTETGR